MTAIKLPSLVPTPSDRAWNGWLAVIGVASAARIACIPLAAQLFMLPYELMDHEMFQSVLRAIMRFELHYLGVPYDDLATWTVHTQLAMSYWMSFIIWGTAMMAVLAWINRRYRWF